MILNSHGGSRYAPLGSVDYRVSPPKDVEEEKKTPLSHSTHHLDPHEMYHAIQRLREDLKHERDRRYARIDTVRKYRKDREDYRAKDRVDYAFAQLQIEPKVETLVKELATACR